ncbi:sensor histidine kinase [Haliangium sp.]|uniref:sensor histidine kinase n=1 Tax=Haliangium sp. TaxID=2663208 RepID=UPI003D0C6D59
MLLAFSLPLLMRWLGSIAVPAAVMLSSGLLTIGASALSDEGFAISMTWWGLWHTGMAMYLLGARFGAWFVGMYVSLVCVDYVAMTQDWRLFEGTSIPRDSVSWLVSEGTALMCVGLLFYVYEVAQRRTMGELTDTLLVTEENERRLESVLESSTAAICSLDTELRLMAFNPAFADMMAGACGRAPMIGARMSEYGDEPRVAQWLSEVEAVLTGRGRRRIEDVAVEGGRRRETVIHPIALGERVIGVTLFSEDIEDRKQMEEERRRLHQELTQVSREAGMASVASEVLHTIGNVLNSVGVSAMMMQAEIKELRSVSLDQAVALMEAHADDLPGFLRHDPQGRRVLALVRALGSHVGAQEQRLRAEGAALQQGVEQLTRVLRAQQVYTRRGGTIETCTAAELVELALSLHAPSWTRAGITIERALQALPPLRIDRNRVIEILVNLIANARRALEDSDRPDKRLVLRAERASAGRVRLVVEDNGVGIAAEAMPKLFELGFTTKADGTGLGLHAGANAARSLGGTLRCESEGVGEGARFILELPVEPVKDPGRLGTTR